MHLAGAVLEQFLLTAFLLLEKLHLAGDVAAVQVPGHVFPHRRKRAAREDITKLRTVALQKHVTRVIVDEKRLTLGVGSGFELQPSAIPKLQSLTRNRFRFGEGKVLVDLPALAPGQRPEALWMPLLRGLLAAL